MATKPKAGGAKKRKPDTPDKEVPKTQRERFIETAREIGVDESGKIFERTAAKVLGVKPYKSKK